MRPPRALSAALAVAMAWQLPGCAKRTDRVAARHLHEALQADPGRYLVVDVRSEAEWKSSSGHIPGAVHVPYPGVKEVAGEAIQPAEGQTVVLICFTGHRSEWAKEAVREATGAEVVDLKGGMLSWWGKSLPVEVEEGAGTGGSDPIR